MGEFTVSKLNGFVPETHVSKSRLSYDQSREGLKVTVLHIPHIKVAHQGEEVRWAKQEGLTDPDAALTHHFKINNPSTMPIYSPTATKQATASGHSQSQSLLQNSQKLHGQLA